MSSIRGAQRCADCRGTGKYVGLAIIESCETCGGTGRRKTQRVDVIHESLLAESERWAQVLQQFGYEAQPHAGVKKYLQRLQDPPDCIVIDHGQTGWPPIDLYCALNKRRLSVPIVVISQQVEKARQMIPNIACAVIDATLPFYRDLLNAVALVSEAETI